MIKKEKEMRDNFKEEIKEHSKKEDETEKSKAW